MASFKELIAQHPLVLVDFSASWCGPCQQLAPILAQLKQDLGTQISIIKIDVDKNASLASSYKVQGVPTMILYRAGEQVWRQSGVVGLPDLKKIIQPYLS